MKIKDRVAWAGCLVVAGLFTSTWVAAGEPEESGIGGTGHQPASEPVPRIIPGADLPTGVELPPAAQMPVVVAPPVLVAPVTPATDTTSVPNTGTVVSPVPQP